MKASTTMKGAAVKAASPETSTVGVGCAKADRSGEGDSNDHCGYVEAPGRSGPQKTKH
jgi:hypothetical protein